MNEELMKTTEENIEPEMGLEPAMDTASEKNHASEKNSDTSMNDVSERERRRAELEREFSYDGYKVVRKELFAHLRDPAVVIRNGNITFNTACISGLEGVVYVKLKINEQLGRLTVQECDKNDKNALRWCTSNGDKRKSRKMTCRPFTDLVYEKMGWDKKCRYKMLGYPIEYQGVLLYVFDLKVPEIFHEKPKKGEEPSEPVDTRKGFYPDDIANTFGVSVEEEERETAVTEMDGFVTMAALTGAESVEKRKNAGSQSVDTQVEEPKHVESQFEEPQTVESQSVELLSYEPKSAGAQQEEPDNKRVLHIGGLQLIDITGQQGSSM